MQHELSATTELLAADTGRISRDLAAVRADVATLGAGLQQQQHELGVLQPRLGRLEALESTNPRASLRLVTALEGKVDNLAAQQVWLARQCQYAAASQHLVPTRLGCNTAKLEQCMHSPASMEPQEAW
jgi:hypothetical protein